MGVVPALVGAAVGVVVGLTATGGGALLTPALVLVLGVPASRAIGSDALIAAGMKLAGSGIYAARREVHWLTVLWLATGSVPGAVLGVAIVNRLPPGGLEAVLTRTLGVALMVAGLSTGLRLLIRPGSRPACFPSRLATVALGVGVGLVVSITSIGSGSLLLAALTWLFPLSAQTIVGTDLVHALVVSTVAAAGHHAAGRVDLGLAGSVLAGAVPGVLAGARLAATLPDRALRACLAALLIGMGLHLSIAGAPAPERPRAATTVATQTPR